MEIDVIIESDGSILPGQSVTEWVKVLDTGYDEIDRELINMETCGA